MTDSPLTKVSSKGACLRLTLASSLVPPKYRGQVFLSTVCLGCSLSYTFGTRQGRRARGKAASNQRWSKQEQGKTV